MDDPRYQDPAPRPDAPPASPQPAPGAPYGAPPPRRGDTGAAVLAHLSQFCTFVGIPGFVGPLVMWFAQRERDDFATDAAKEALNFQISLWIYAAALFVALLALFFDGVGSLLVLLAVCGVLLVIGSLVLPIVAAVRVNSGEAYRYPLTIRLFR